MQLLISTVYHTGTHSLVDHLGLDPKEKQRSWDWIHCCQDVIDKADQYDIHTTFRDPYEVAISWANRRDITQGERKWREQWRCWAELVPIATIYPVEDLPPRLSSVKDPSGLYEMLRNGDMDAYHRKIPFNFVEIALKYIQTVPDGIRVPTRG